MSELKSLDQHNKERYEAHKKNGSLKTNGIACPKCRHEMVDVQTWYSPGRDLPEIEVECVVCHYRSHRLP